MLLFSFTFSFVPALVRNETCTGPLSLHPDRPAPLSVARSVELALVTFSTWRCVEGAAVLKGLFYYTFKGKNIFDLKSIYHQFSRRSSLIFSSSRSSSRPFRLNHVNYGILNQQIERLINEALSLRLLVYHLSERFM